MSREPRRGKGMRVTLSAAISLLCLVMSCTGVFAQTARAPATSWTPDEPIADTDWVYNERYAGKTLNQCQIEAKVKANNGSDSTLTVAVLSKGTLALVIRDENWRYRIKSDFGWKVGQQYRNLLFHLKEGRLAATGRAISDEEFLIELPKQQEILLKAFFTDEGKISITVAGITFKSWTVPGLSKGWERLKRCPLL